ncbi:hypothetical protein [Neorhizobium sp. T7_12]|jgi:hypothetical protein|nr:hypothetical protein [Neorhizobium sp. T7_12]
MINHHGSRRKLFEELAGEFLPWNQTAGRLRPNTCEQSDDRRIAPIGKWR